MKGNIKKLAVLVIVPVIALFIMAAMASANPPVQHAIRGQYAGTGGGACLVAVCGFDDQFVPINVSSGAWQTMAYTEEAVFIFESDGTGNASETMSLVITPSTSPAVPWPSAGTYAVSWTFTYAVDQSGLVTITEVPDSRVGTFTSGPLKGTTDTFNGYKRTGTIASGGAIITLSGGLPDVITINTLLACNVPAQQICNYSATLIHQHN